MVKDYYEGEIILAQKYTNQLVETGARDSSEASYLVLNRKPYIARLGG